MQLPVLPSGWEPEQWPAVTVVVPARNEAAVLPSMLPTLVEQDYPGPLRVLLVDDSSADGTAGVAASIGARSGVGEISVVSASPLPDGWAGKVWAMHTGAASDLARDCDYILLTDADIAQPPDLLRRLVGMAQHRDLDLASVMAHLRPGRPHQAGRRPDLAGARERRSKRTWLRRTVRGLARGGTDGLHAARLLACSTRRDGRRTVAGIRCAAGRGYRRRCWSCRGRSAC